MRDTSRFRTTKQAISYCGLCGDEKISADKVVRTPISKKRNKHIQQVLVEAAAGAGLQPGTSPAVRRGTAARTWRQSHAGGGSQDGGHMLAVERLGTGFIPADEFSPAGAI